MLKKIVVFLFFISSSLSLLAQSDVGLRYLKWKNPVVETLPDGREVSYICFQKAIYDSKTQPLPTYYETIKLSGNPTDISVSLINDVYEPLTSAEVNLATQKNIFLSTKIKIIANVGYSQKQAFAQIKFIPIRKNTFTGAYEKLVSFSFIIQNVKEELKTHRTGSMSFAANSVLATGKWYKIGVTQDGIYKLSYQYLKNIGMDMTTINPKNIRVYGNGGGMLPLPNSTFRHDDLVEDPIFVNEQNNTTLDSAGYLLFYGQGPVIWKYDSTDTRFHHQSNYYSDTTFYFITADLGAGKRIANIPSATQSITNTVSSFDDYNYHELDGVNLIRSGNQWYGEQFNILNSYNFSFNFPNIDVSSKVWVNTDLVARSSSNGSFSVSSQSGSTTLITTPVAVTCFDCIYASEADSSYVFTPSSSNITVTVTNNTPAAVGWLNFIELNARRQLTMVGNQMEFQDTKSVGATNISQFNVSSFLPITIWDVTDPTNAQQITMSLSGTTYQYTLPTPTLRKFISFTGNNFLIPQNFGSVANQNLHAYQRADLIIVTNPKFVNQANNLANFHANQDNLNVVVATTNQIYNEFSGGEQDPVGIRDFVKMFYDRASNPSNAPKYLLLMGRGSYDNKYRIPNNTDYIPTYESDNSLDPTSSYVSDDFYALLDDNEGDWTSSYMLDIGVGRMPVQTTQDAQNIINKVIRYETKTGALASSGNNCNCGSQAQNYNLTDWRNQICFVAHDGDITFESQSDQLATQVETAYPDYNINKIYFDAYVEQTTPGGERYPDVENAINQQVQKGAFIVNYLGHGGVFGWGLERVLSISDIQSWTNMNTLPLFITATCEFSRFDDPEQVAAGEDILLNPIGGGIGLLTTVRVVYSGPNFTLNQNFFNVLQSPMHGTFPRMGDLMMETKNLSGTNVNNRNFTFLGDPAVTPAFPHFNVTTTSVGGILATSPTMDTIKALTKVTIIGFVSDSAGSKVSNFNGIIYPTVYDKPNSITTLSNGGTANNPPFTFQLQNSVLYKGKVSVINGNFSFTFVVPKDIAYNFGKGRISYYAENGVQDAAGQFGNFVVGGSNPNPPKDVTGPSVKLYLNDNKFVYGGMTNENPQLYATVFDSSGINTVGNGIGHDITAILDRNTAGAINLNTYYQADMNSYQSGSVTYPFTGLSPGTHTLTLRVWDVYNNSSEVTTEFVVAQAAQFQLDHVLNYPNPFTTNTNFYFEQNFGCGQFAVQIQIFTVSGKLVKTIAENVQTQGFRSDPIEWNGKDDYGDKIGRGVYVYHLIVKASDGSIADKYDKLVIL
ncbi:MAG: type IX secretion system sortase PorU [Bacteroidia bacterium]